MNEIRKKLVDAHHDGSFLKVISNLSLHQKEKRDALSDEMVLLHNQGVINIISEFTALRNDESVNVNFFSIRRLFEKPLPKLNAPVLEVMDCVNQLVNEAGNDMMAGSLYSPFIEFCEASPERSKEVLEIIKKSPGEWPNFLAPAVIAGVHGDMEHYLRETIQLVIHENIEIKKSAIFTLGKIQYPESNGALKEAFSSLEQAANQNDHDQLLSNIISSAFNLYTQDESLLKGVVSIISISLSKGGDFTVYAASALFGYNIDKLPDSLLDVLIPHFEKVNPENKGTLDNIDYGLDKLFKRDDSMKGILLLENILINSKGTISIEVFDSTVHTIIEKHDPLLNKLFTRWFLTSDFVLCESIFTIIGNIHGRNIELNIDINELPSNDEMLNLFIARKAVGFLFIKPVTCASIIISIIENSKDDGVIKELSSLLFNPILMNYPGDPLEYLKERIKGESSKVRDAIQTSVDALNDYLAELKAIPHIPELQPSQAHREASARRFNEMMAKSFKQAMKGSITEMLCSKSVILYGRSSIHQFHNASGEKSRTVTQMQQHGSTIEIPRLESLDPYGLDYTLRVFRAERITNT